MGHAPLFVPRARAGPVGLLRVERAPRCFRARQMVVCVRPWAWAWQFWGGGAHMCTSVPLNRSRAQQTWSGHGIGLGRGQACAGQVGALLHFTVVHWPKEQRRAAEHCRETPGRHSALESRGNLSDCRGALGPNTVLLSPLGICWGGSAGWRNYGGCTHTPLQCAQCQ